MNLELKHALHDLRSLMDKINSLYSCIVFDLKDNASFQDEDFSDLKIVLSEFEQNLNRIKKK